MNPDLNLLLTILTTNKTLIQVALHIPDGANSFPDWEYCRELAVYNEYMKYLPNYISDQTDVILSVNKLYTIVK